MEHQDWKPVVWNKKNKQKDTKHNQRQGNKTFRQLDSDNPLAPSKITLKYGQAIQKERCKNNMTQKQLAQKINVSVAVIRSYETSNTVPNGIILQKINKLLGLNLKHYN